MTTRLVVAYALIALLVLAAAGIAWWNVHHSRPRTEARQRARRRAAQRLRDER
jgi:hypothetical protein